MVCETQPISIRRTMQTLMILSAVMIHSSVGSMLGMACDNSVGSVPCRIVNSVCVNGICQCSSTFAPNGTHCVPIMDTDSTIDQPCATNSDCAGDGEFCSSSGYCRCVDSFVLVNKQCLKVMYPGQFGCEDGRQCAKAFPGAMCRQRRCICPDNLLVQEQSCVPSAQQQQQLMQLDTINADTEQQPNQQQSLFEGVADATRTDDEEVNNNVVSRRSRLTVDTERALFDSVAPADHRRRAPTPQLTPQAIAVNSVPPGGICSTDNHCAGYPNAYCSGTCMCKPNTINAGSTCIVHGNPDTSQCSAGQVYVSEAGICMNSATPGSPCQYSQQCSGSEAGAFCVAQRCRCVYGMVVTADGKCTFQNTNCTQRGTVWIQELGECKQVLAPGSRPCSHQQQCTAAYRDTTCFLQQCTCPIGLPVAVDGTCGNQCAAGQTFSGVLGKCVPTAQPGNRCLYSSQCHAIYAGMLCENGVCRCPNNEKWTGTICAQQCPPGYIVNPNTGACRQGCRANQVEYQGECLDKVPPGMACTINPQCTGGSSCQTSVCTCPRGTSNQFGTCQQIESAPGQTCANGERCSGGSQCVNNLCTCTGASVNINGQCITPTTVPPGSPCSDFVQCGGNSYCIAGICTCSTNLIAINGQCQMPPPVGPGSACQSSTTRCTGGAYCQNGKCTCPIGTVVFNGQCQVPPQVPPGATCAAGETCTGLSTCSNNLCRCPQNMVIQGVVCRVPALVPPGSSCANQERCSGGSSCVNSVCACPSGAAIVNNICQTFRIVPPGSSCASGELCTGGANCIGLVCQCPNGLVVQGSQCVLVQTVRPFEFCNNGEVCGGNSFCNGIQCLCPPGTNLVGNVCQFATNARLFNIRNATNVPLFPTQPSDINNQRPRELPQGGSWPISPTRVHFMGNCEHQQQCGGGSRCEGHLCRCPAGQIPVSNTCQFVPANAGESCAHGETCLGGSYCVHKECACMNGESVVNGVCLNTNTVVPPKADCRNRSTVCGGDSRCVRGVCQCSPNKVIRRQRCVEPEKVNPGASCRDGEVCQGGSRCERDVCKCSASKVIRQQRCVDPEKVNPGASCRNKEICQGGSRCERDVCTCPPNQIVRDNLCIVQPEAKPGESCARGEICTGGSRCGRADTRVCQCAVTQMIQRDQCVEKRRVPPSHSCGNEEICTGESQCANGRCTCAPSMVIRNQRCIAQPKIPPGARCQMDEKCLGGSACKQDHCKCPDGNYIEGQTCQRKRRSLPGAVCDRERYICDGRSSCNETSRKCECSEGHIIMDNLCVPRPDSKPRESCAKGERCIGDSQCNEGICRCMQGHIVINETCMNPPAVGPGKSCANGEICSGQSICMNYLCTCPRNMVVRDEQCIVPPTVSPGMSCRNKEICGGGSNCENGRCTCPVGLTVRDNACVNPPVGPFFTCKSSSECVGSASCSHGVCLCPPNSLMVEGHCRKFKQPTRTALPGGTCMEDLECSGKSWCINGTCQCPDGFVVEHSICTEVIEVLPGEPCSEVLKCSKGSECVQGICLCLHNYILQNGTCLPQTINVVNIRSHRLISTLEEDEKATKTQGVFGAKMTNIIIDSGAVRIYCNPVHDHCSGGSVCVGGMCVCAPGMQLHNGFCISIYAAAPGASCLNGERCIGGSSCVRGVCECPSELRAVINGECSRARIENVGREHIDPNLAQLFAAGLWQDPVQLVDELTRNYAFSARMTNRMLQPTGVNADHLFANDALLHVARDDPIINELFHDEFINFNVSNQRLNDNVKKMMQVESRTQFGMPCFADYQTCAGGGVCSSGICSCGQGSVWMPESCTQQDAVQNAAIPGSMCDGFTVCTGDSTCVNFVCVCARGKVQLDSACVSLVVGAGFSCANGEVCCAGSFCNGATCVCPEGTVQAESQCVNQPSVQVPPYSPCDSTSVCLGGSFCQNGFCLCPTGYTVQNNQCIAVVKYVSAGSACQPSDVCMGNSICANSFCTCPSGEEIRDGQCIARSTLAYPDQPCTPGRSTCWGGSNCINNICTCPISQIAVNNACQMRPNQNTGIPGDACTSVTLCLGGSTCVNGFCACPPTTVVDGNQCSFASNNKLSPGDQCTMLAGTQTCGGGSFCYNSYCTCPQGEVIFQSKCVQYVDTVGPGQSCVRSGVICGGGSLCMSGFCSCPSNLIQQNSQCIEFNNQPGTQSDPLEDCTPGSTSCTGGSQCSSQYRKCVCPQGRVAQNGQCTNAPRALGAGSYCDSYCTASAVCALQCGGGSVCMNGYCSCAGGSKLDILTNTCTSSGQPSTTSTTLGPNETRYPGDACTNSVQCSGLAFCDNSLCRCPPGYEPNPTTRNCMLSGEGGRQFVPPGSVCTSSTVICTGNSVCERGLCLCPIGTVNINGRCTISDGSVPTLVEPGSPCDSTTLACGGGAGCVNGYCVCGIGRVVNTQGRCVSISEGNSVIVLPGSACADTSAPCDHNSQCRSGFCVCLPGTIARQGFCVTEGAKVPVGNSCTANSQCIQWATCRNGICYCQDGYVLQASQCVRLGPLPDDKQAIGAQCSSTFQCTDVAVCQGNICTCPSGTQVIRNQCVSRQSTVPPGSWCSNVAGIECYGGSYCYNNICSCPFGQVMTNLQCAEAPVVVPGDSCMNGELCGGGAQCNSGSCQCTTGSDQNGPFCQSQLVGRAEPCPLPRDPSRCRLPNCFCSRQGIDIPGGLDVTRTPQMIVLTFDDPITDMVTAMYNGTDSVFSGRLKNPNGCPIKATFYVSHEWNNYDATEWLAYNGHEIGVNSITHETIDAQPVERWRREMEGMRMALNKFSNVQSNRIKGVRAPQLGIGGDNQFQMMTRQNFSYDNSMSVNPGRENKPFWPQTLDYKLPWRCEQPPCPQRSYPGIWELPINQFYGYYIPEIQKHKRAAMVRAAMLPDDSIDSVVSMLRDNFNRAYKTNRAPYTLTLNADFLNILPEQGGKQALQRFLDEALTLEDVWVVTAEQALAWLKTPTTTDQLRNFAPWRCPQRTDGERPCFFGRECRFDTQLPGVERQFRTCHDCPINYPWLNDPTGMEYDTPRLLSDDPLEDKH